MDSLRSNKLVTQIMHLNDDIWKDFGLNFISIVQVKLWHRKLGSEIHFEQTTATDSQSELIFPTNFKS